MAKKKHNKQKETYGCMLCSFTTTDQEKQAQHWIEAHSKRMPKAADDEIRCEYCGDRFRTREGLDHHYQAAHQGVMELTK